MRHRLGQRLEFDLRRPGAEMGGYSGGLVLSDDEGSISFVGGNSAKVRDRHYVCVNYRAFDLTCDREDFPDLTRETPIAKWYSAAITVLLSKLGPINFIGLVNTLFENGKAVGANEARAEIRQALRNK